MELFLQPSTHEIFATATKDLSPDHHPNMFDVTTLAAEKNNSQVNLTQYRIDI